MLSAKDFFLQIGVAVTLLLGLVNLYFTLKAGKRATFINTVTSERVKWIAKVRHNVSTLGALCDQWMMHRPQDDRGELKFKIEQLKNEILLQLNPEDPTDQEIAALIARLPSWRVSMGIDQYYEIQAELVSATQRMLKREWDKVKSESVDGDLRPRYLRRNQ